jgi:hypothetical protein
MEGILPPTPVYDKFRCVRFIGSQIPGQVEDPEKSMKVSLS